MIYAAKALWILFISTNFKFLKYHSKLKSSNSISSWLPTEWYNFGWRPSKIDGRYTLTGIVPEKIRLELKNIKRWKNGEIIVLDSKTNNQIDYKSKPWYV